MKKNTRKLFLGATGAEGFTSFFGECYDPRDNWRAFIIKGGPGTGKSSLMKTVAKSVKAAGLDPILAYCSSDPDSLDGVIINEKKTVILDGTAPHVVEPSLYGAVETIVNPGELLDIKALREKVTEIAEITGKNKYYHLTASRYLAAAGQVKKDNLRLMYGCLDEKKTREYTEKLIKKYFKRQDKKGKTLKAFLSAVTSKGAICFTDSAKLWCRETVIIEDKNIVAAREIIRLLSAAATECGYDTVCFKDPVLPRDTEHLVIPELSLGFFVEDRDICFDIETRRVHTRRFYNTAALSRIKNKTQFNRKVYKELIKAAAYNLKYAKEIHDKIEEYYINAMDFRGMGEITQKLLKAIFDIKML